jgi:hypothetical protein
VIGGMVITGDQVREALRVLRVTEHAVIEDIRKITIGPSKVEAEILLRDAATGGLPVGGADFAFAVVTFPVQWADPDAPAGADMPARGEGIPDRWPA